jgi:hypothetical protein
VIAITKCVFYGERDRHRSLLGGAAVWPLAARAQQPAMPVVAVINPGTPSGMTRYAAAFRSAAIDQLDVR